jgi:hypothetical protein
MAADVGQRLDAVCGQQAEEVAERAVRVADREDVKRGGIGCWPRGGFWYHAAMRTQLLVLVCAAAALAAPARATTSAPPKTAGSATPKWNPAVPFIEDDFGRALALAKERKLPVFIEGWAPW